eukprot:TRINITY_DN86864_c0_g1_i1.p1 TRINITY_DN86864_c0_g1~~TRINITY_DN86864_c0_g1_i1.p1  ORF type:complete len:158 (-),score=16.12 TRINITY_DN86864_c0_g1_i1:154-627(-)
MGHANTCTFDAFKFNSDCSSVSYYGLGGCANAPVASTAQLNRCTTTAGSSYSLGFPYTYKCFVDYTVWTDPKCTVLAMGHRQTVTASPSPDCVDLPGNGDRTEDTSGVFTPDCKQMYLAFQCDFTDNAAGLFEGCVAMNGVYIKPTRFGRVTKGGRR